MTKYIVALVFPALLTACASTEEPAAGVATGMLQTRDYIVTMYTGNQGSRYSVHSLDGNLLDEDINMETMVARFPELRHLRNNDGIEWADVDRSLLYPDQR